MHNAYNILQSSKNDGQVNLQENDGLAHAQSIQNMDDEVCCSCGGRGHYANTPNFPNNNNDGNNGGTKRE